MIPYKSADVTLQKGDIVVMYTDGVTEALDETEEEYGEERLQKCLLCNASLSARDILNAILEDVKLFTGNRYSDDITIVVLKKKLTPGAGYSVSVSGFE